MIPYKSAKNIVAEKHSHIGKLPACPRTAARIPSMGYMNGLRSVRYASVGYVSYKTCHVNWQHPSVHNGKITRIHIDSSLAILETMLAKNTPKKPHKSEFASKIRTNHVHEKLVKLNCSQVNGKAKGIAKIVWLNLISDR